MLFYVSIEKEEYPVVGIKCLESSDEATISKQHLLFWNRNDVSISVIILSGELRIYNNFSRKRIKALLYNSSDVQNSDDIINDLRASKIITKVVWERLKKLSNSGERVDKQLLSNLRNTVLQAQSECGMLLEDAYNFMFLCIFVKYLEDRGMLTSQFFAKWDTDTFTNFLNIANPEKLSEFFRILKKRFNGDLFSISEEKLPADKQLDVFYRFFRGDDILDNGNSQLRLFPYDFSVIPIGLISNIYETFFSIEVTNKNSEKFLSYILDNYCIESITNLEAVKTQLFDHAKYPCSIWEYRCIKKENYVLKYQVFQENGLFKLLHKFVYDKTEEISISKNRIIGREYIWTILTYEDEFDVECIEKMLSFPALGQSINGKIDFVQGYITVSNGNRNPEFAGYRGRSLKGVFLLYGVDYERVPMLSQDTLFDRPRKIDIYTCSHKVFWENG